MAPRHTLQERADRVLRMPERGWVIGDLLGLIQEMRDSLPPSKSVAIELLEDRITALTVHNQSLLTTNTEYLNRARDAESKVRAWEVEMPEIEKRIRVLEEIMPDGVR
jgi:hypothetical protein